MNKKHLFLLCIALLPLFCLAACGEPPTVSADFAADFHVTQDETDYCGTLSLDGENLHIEMTEPYTVAGTGFDYAGKELTITAGGHSTQANSDYLPSRAVPSVLHNTLAYLAQAAYTDSEDGADRFTLPTPHGEATLTARDSLPVSLYDPHTKLTFTFDNYSE